jgi:hypothetical protein
VRQDYTPNDMWGCDEVDTHILIDGQINGEARKLVTHSARNGFVYTLERANGQIVLAKPYMDKINWTRGIDEKTGRPLAMMDCEQCRNQGLSPSTAGLPLPNGEREQVPPVAPPTNYPFPHFQKSRSSARMCCASTILCTSSAPSTRRACRA